MSDLVAIIGAGGHGREALAVARSVIARTASWNSAGVYDDQIDSTDRDRLERTGAVYAGSVHDVISDSLPHVIAVGDPITRRSIAARIGHSAPAIQLVDPSAWVGDDVALAEGVLIYPLSICTTNVRVGRHSHLNCRVVVSHDCRIGEFVSLSPGVVLNGSVTIDDGAFLGTGAAVLPGRRVGQDAVVGAGAVVVDDVAAGTTVVGTPARPIS